LEQEAEEMKLELNQLAAQKNDLKEQAIELNTNKTVVTEDLSELEEELKELNHDMFDLGESIEDMRDKIQMRKDEIEHARQTGTDLHIQFDRLPQHQLSCNELQGEADYWREESQRLREENERLRRPPPPAMNMDDVMGRKRDMMPLRHVREGRPASPRQDPQRQQAPTEIGIINQGNP
jgi:chromosome segregation ATPase